MPATFLMSRGVGDHGCDTCRIMQPKRNRNRYQRQSVVTGVLSVVVGLSKSPLSSRLTCRRNSTQRSCDASRDFGHPQGLTLPPPSVVRSPTRQPEAAAVMLSRTRTPSRRRDCVNGQSVAAKQDRHHPPPLRLWASCRRHWPITPDRETCRSHQKPLRLAHTTPV